MKTAKVGKDSVAQLGMDEEEEDVKERKPVLQKLESIVVPQESVVKRYLQFNGKLSNLVLVAGLFLLTQFACSGADAFVAYWIRVERNNYDGNTSISEIAMNNKEEQSDLRIRFVLISSSLVVLILFLGILRTLVFNSSTTRISKAIHREMLNGVLNTRLRFFEVNPSGRVLNKFSRDLGRWTFSCRKYCWTPCKCY